MMESLLDTFMASLMGITKELWPKAGALRNEDAAVVQQPPVNQLPPFRCCASSQLMAQVLCCCILLQFLAQGVVVGEEWAG